MSYTPAPPMLVRLRGSQAEMGAQHGRLLVEAGGYEQALSFYPRMASAMLSLSIPHPVRGVTRRALQAGLTVGAERLDRERRRRFPEYAARTDALLKAGGLAPSFGRALAVMDVLQNTVGAVGRLGLLAPTGLQVGSVPGPDGEGEQWDFGEVDFRDQGRARVMNENHGRIRVYANRTCGVILGAELIGPRVEHIAHLLAWAIEQRMTVPQALAMPYYHPVVEEGLRTAMQQLGRELKMAPKPRPLDCGPGT